MPWGRHLISLLKVLGVFVLLGPPIGALTFFAGIGVYGASQTGNIADVMWIFLFGLIYAVPLSYLMGAIPAAITGLILGALAIFHRIPGTPISAATGVLVGLGLVHSGGRPTLPHNIESASEYVPAFLLIATCLVATVICWAVARRLIRESRGSSPPIASIESQQ